MKKRIVALVATAVLTLSFSASAFAATGTVERPVKFRSEAATTSSVYSTLRPGTSFTVLDKVNAWWYKVSVNGKPGYVSANYVNVASPPAGAPNPEPPHSGAKADNVIANAKALLGKVQYAYGKNQAPSVMDCSAFTKYVFGKEGVVLGWGTRYQKDAGSYVARSELQPGDLVLFRIGSAAGIGHVGVYLGNGQFIHNSPSNNGGVGISSLSSGYWNDRYVTGRRVL